MRAVLERIVVRTLLSKDRIARFVARPRSNGADGGLDRQIAAILVLQQRAKLPTLESMEPVAARKFAEAGLSPLDVDTIPMDQVIETTAGGVPARIFVPYGAGDDWLVYYHGGGGVIGSIAGAEPVTRYLAHRSRCTVASIEYRLAPEHKHPAAIDDACAAYRALAERVRGKIAIGGDSFGGYLTAQVDRFTRDQRVRRPAAQLLIYPLVDLTLTSPSIEKYADGYLLTKSMMHYFRNHYLHDTDDRRAGSPWFWTEVRDTSPAIIATAGFDPLVDEGDAWAARLRESGTQVRHHRYDSLVHGFISMGGAIRAARAAIDELCADLVDLLRS